MNPLQPIARVVLEGRNVRLEPLTRDHAVEMRRAASASEIWQWTLMKVTDDASFESYFASTLAEADKGAALPFAILDKDSRRVIGCTRYFDIHPEHKNLEIGYTWLAPSAWRTAINTECKHLLLRHAFETLGCVRVQLKTNVNNARSRAAIERIGGQFEGIVRKHVVNPDGTYRDTVFYSIVDDEWPTVKARLEAKLGAPRAEAATA